jgi:hypothetical protein
MADSTLYDTTVPTAGSVALAHESIIRVKRNGVWENITGDVNNLLDTPTPVVVAREVYGTKGAASSENIAYTHAITFTAEGVRDNTGAIAQAWLAELIKVSARTGAANKVEVQIFDAKDENLPAFQGLFNVAQVPGNTGYADKRVYSITLNSAGVVAQITSPIAGTGIPVLESALPSGKGAGGKVVVRGYKLGTPTAATVGGVTVPANDITAVDANTIVLELPTGSAGSAPIIVTNAAGPSTALPYTRVV